MHEDLNGLKSLMAGVAPGSGGKLLDSSLGFVPNPAVQAGTEEPDELRVCISLVGSVSESETKCGKSKGKQKLSAYKAQQQDAQKTREACLDVALDNGYQLIVMEKQELAQLSTSR